MGLEGRKMPGKVQVRATEKLLLGAPLKLFGNPPSGKHCNAFAGDACECPAHQTSVAGTGRAKHTTVFPRK